MSEPKRNQTNKFVWPDFIISSIFAGVYILGQLLFGSSGKWLWMVQGTKIVPSWLVGSLSAYLLHILSDAAIIWLLFLLVKRPLHVGDAIKFWLVSFLIGWSFIILLLFLDLPVFPFNLFNSVFLLTRHAFPVISSIFIFILAQPWLLRLTKLPHIKALIYILFTVNIIFDLDIIKFGNGTSMSGIFLLGIISILIYDKKNWFNLRNWLLIIVGSTSILIIGLIQTGVGASLGKSLRFVTQGSIFTVIPAALVVQAVINLVDSNFFCHATPNVDVNISIFSRMILFGSVLMSTGTAYDALMTKSANKIEILFQQFGYLWIIPEVICLIVMVVAISGFVWFFLSRSTLWSRLEINYAYKLLDALELIYNDFASLIRRFLSRHWRVICTFLTLFVAQCTSTLLMNQSWKMDQLMTHANDNIIAFEIIGGMPKMLGGTFILFVIYLLLVTLINRYWVSLIGASAFSVFFAIASRLKIESRSAPIVPADLDELKSFGSLIRLVDQSVVLLIIIGIVSLIALVVFLESHTEPLKQTWRTRIRGLVISSFIVMGTGTMHHQYSFNRNILRSFGIYIDRNLNMLLYAQQNGPIANFLSLLDIEIMKRPQGYSENAVRVIYQKYLERSKEINKERIVDTKDLTVVFNLSESFANPSHINGLHLTKNPTPYIDSLKEKTTSGMMISAGYGGGTANMEYMSLTGISVGLFSSGSIVPNNQVVPRQKVALNVGNLFDYSSAIHPYNGGYYNRPTVYQKYGFDKFAYLGSKYEIKDQKKLGTSPYLSDQTAYSNTLKQIQSRKSGQFINLITMQNHMPYQDWYGKHEYGVSGRGFAPGQKKSVENYAQGLSYTDQAIKKFIQQIDRENKPIIFVFYGDHLPGIYNLSTSVGKYATDYFVYSNKYARQHAENMNLTNTSYISTNDFIALALRQANVKTNAYTALLNDVQSKLPAIWQAESGSIGSTVKNSNSSSNMEEYKFVNNQGRIVKFDDLSRSQQKLFKDYQMIQYDLTVGKEYCIKIEKEVLN